MGKKPREFIASIAFLKEILSEVLEAGSKRCRTVI